MLRVAKLRSGRSHGNYRWELVMQSTFMPVVVLTFMQSSLIFVSGRRNCEDIDDLTENQLSMWA